MLHQNFENLSISAMQWNHWKAKWRSRIPNQDWEELERNWKAGFKLELTAIFPKRSGLVIGWVCGPFRGWPF
jgi:hypothetical protein